MLPLWFQRHAGNTTEEKGQLLKVPQSATAIYLIKCSLPPMLECPSAIPTLWILILAPCECVWKSRRTRPECWAAVTDLEALDGLLGAWFRSGSALAIPRSWGVISRWGSLSVSASKEEERCYAAQRSKQERTSRTLRHKWGIYF